MENKFKQHSETEQIFIARRKVIEKLKNIPNV